MSATTTLRARSQVTSTTILANTRSSDYAPKGPEQSQAGYTSTLHVTASRPPLTLSNFVTEIRWFNLSVVTLTPLLAIFGLYTTNLHKATVAFSVLCYIINMLGKYLFFLWHRLSCLFSLTIVIGF